MKKMNFICFFGCMLLLIFCTKPYSDYRLEGGKLEKEREKDKHDNELEKKLVLKRITQYTPTNLEFLQFEYNFHFSKKGQLDSVVINNKPIRVIVGLSLKSVHHIYHSKGRIDSVVRIVFGSPLGAGGVRFSVKSDFEYDKSGNITRFKINRLFPNFPPGLQPISFTYDRGRLHTILQSTLSPPPLADTFTYVRNNIARWNTTLTGVVPIVRSFTYDLNHDNPLYFIDDLLVILMEAELSEEFLLPTENVSITQLIERTQQLLTYENFFDRKGRLIKKVIGSDSLVFTYAK